MNLCYEDGKNLILKAIEKDTEDILYQRWLIDYSKMDKKNFMSFEEYKSKFIIRKVDNKSMDDVLKEAEEIKLKVSQKRGE